MDNCTNCSLTVPEHLGLGVVAGILTCVLIIAIISAIITIVGLCMAHSVNKILRIFLLNILVAVLIMALSVLLIMVSTLILNYTASTTPDPLFCRFAIWGLQIGTALRLYGLAGFSIIVLMVVKYSSNVLKPLVVSALMVFIWLFPILVHFYTFVPAIYGVQFYKYVMCFPNSADVYVILRARVAFTVIGLIVNSIVPLIVCIVIPIVVLCFIKHNTMTEERSSYGKGLAKFALFLVVGNFLNFLGIVLISIVAYFSAETTVYLTYIFATIFLLPTPIFVLIFVKPVRKSLWSVITSIFRSCT